ncbi:murein L,D-transpeptidase catalytic domain family protein [Niastella vici]|nr:murein L,D-transpeptidase catalytic domain family protein [Niastella vici]
MNDTAKLAGVIDSVSRFSILYDQMNLDSLGLSQDAFKYGLQGYLNLVSNGAIKNDHILSIVDFSLPSSKKRLFVIDVMTGKLLFNTFVSHGRNSGQEMATEFSNDLNSFKSSLGFFVTGNTYSGEHGYSLRLEGQEAGINDNAHDRDIVMHAANYVNEKIIKAKGFIGRSLGCPAVPPSVHKAIINTIKNGSCLFLYSPDTDYISHSKIINQPMQQPVTG